MLKKVTLFLVVSLLGCTRAACPPTGDLMMPHEGDTTKYVFCREGRELTLSCDDGTAYNPLTKRCDLSRDWSERAPTCLFNQTETVYFPHETSCSMFYSCAYGVTSLETCPEGLEYNQDLRSCDWPSPNGCFAQTTTPPPTESTTEITTESTTEIITDPTTESTTEIITDPTTESTTEIITDPTTESTTEIITDPTTESTTGIITDPTTESTTEIITETTTEITSESPTDSTPTDPPVNCPLNGTDITLIPHPTKCDTFYICWYGIPTLMECYFDYEFDVAAGGCVLISDSGCTASKTSTTDVTTEFTTDITTEFTTDITTESTTATSTDPTPVDPPVKCPPSGTITMIPHPTKCDTFYICWEGIPTLMECYFGYEFDIQAGGCVLISDSGCTASKTTIQNTELVTSAGLTPTFTPECDPDTLEITLIPHPTNCQVYYVCWAGIATSISCIYDYEFDVASGKCVLISSTGCTASKTTSLVWSTSTESSLSIIDNNSPVRDELDSKALRHLSWIRF